MNYLILYDPSIYATKSADEVHKLLTTLPGTIDWWHHLPNSYIVTSTMRSVVISNLIYKYMPDMRFLIVRIELNDSNGVLKKDAFDWINKHKSMATPLRTILKASMSPSKPISPFPSLFPYLPQTPTTSPSSYLSELFKNSKKN